jgi:hypothetical protein
VVDIIYIRLVLDCTEVLRGYEKGLKLVLSGYQNGLIGREGEKERKEDIWTKRRKERKREKHSL